MRLIQSGPEQDTAGELISRLIVESDDLAVLKTAGLEIAAALGAKDVLWIHGPARTWHSLEAIPERCYLAIRP